MRRDEKNRKKDRERRKNQTVSTSTEGKTNELTILDIRESVRRRDFGNQAS